MPKLPRVRSVVICCCSLLLYFLLATSYLLLATNPVRAAPGDPPAPLPCQNAIFDESKLTDNWLTGENGEPFITVPKQEGYPAYFRFDIDFSKLSALFGPTSSDYLEGKFQDKDHKEANISQLDAAAVSKFHGAGQKAAPKAMLDPLKVATVKYIYEKNTLAESADIYTDFNGNDPKTIYEMRNAFGEPDPETQRSTDAWQNGWGRYWDKIPTTYSEFYEGRIIFKYAHGHQQIENVINGSFCPPQLPHELTFIMPAFFRTTATTGQLNQVIVPNAAQSDHSNDMVIAQDNTTENQNVLGKIISNCVKFIKKNPISESLKKVISKLPNILNPVGDVFALESEGCIRVLDEGKEGQGPYCALPASELQLPFGELGPNCTNQIDEFKQDKENPNVICTFIFSIPASYPAGMYGVWPVFRIPLIAEIWNNTLFSDTEENEPSIGSALDQVEGRPGVYSAFTPRAVFETEEDKLVRKLNELVPKCNDEILNEGTFLGPACSELINIVNGLDTSQYPAYDDCVEQAFGNLGGFAPERAIAACAGTIAQQIIHNYEKKLPAEAPGGGVLGQNSGQVLGENSGAGAKQRFLGGTDCSKEFVWHNALYPKAAQDEYGITNACPLQAAAQPPDIGTPPGTFPPTQDNCNGRYELDNPIGNFGDPDCDLPSEEDISSEIARLDPQNAHIWICIVGWESSFNPNAYAAVSTAGQALGLFQMGHAAYPQYGLDYQIADPDTEYDRGDVYWHGQIANAINYNNHVLGGDFFLDGVSYWEPMNRGLCP